MTDMSETKYQFTVNDWTEGNTVHTELIERNCSCGNIAQNNRPTLLYAQIENCLTVQYAMIGLERPKTTVAKRHDWSEMTFNNNLCLLYNMSEMTQNYCRLIHHMCRK